jgi:hypothetical protein
MKLKVMNIAGIKAFQEYLSKLKSDGTLEKPDYNTGEYSYEYGKECVMLDDINPISTRMQLAQYLDKVFTENSIHRSEVIGDRGLWTWLSYAWFDRLAPKDAGFRKVKEYYSYVYVPSYRRSYRHSIASAYLLYTGLGESLSRLFLECDINEHNDFVEQLASSGYIVSNKSIIEAAHLLYWDSVSGKAKRGSQTRNKTGTLRRFISVLGQLEINYDIYTATSEEILNLLPSEFDKWKSPS